MENKPQIEYDKLKQHFIVDGVIIGDKAARFLWDEGSCDWTLCAYQEMSMRVMS